MADRHAKDGNGNVVGLPRRAASSTSGDAASLSSTDNRHIAEGLRLVRSFMAIEDPQTRASIIRIVEEIAEHSSIFSNKLRK